MLCQNCRSAEVVRRGYRKMASFRGRKQIFWCKACDRTFTYDDGFKKMRNPPTRIKAALWLRGDGFSLKQVAGQLGDKVSRQTILNWEKKFSGLPFKIQTAEGDTPSPVLG